MAHMTTPGTQMMLTKRQSVWICRRMMKIWHPELRGDMESKQKYWQYFIDTLHKAGYIDDDDHETWQCPFK